MFGLFQEARPGNPDVENDFISNLKRKQEIKKDMNYQDLPGCTKQWFGKGTV